MGIDVSLALEEGAGRLASVPGVIVAVVFVLAGLVELALTQTIATRLLDQLFSYVGASTIVADQVRQEYAANTALDLGIGIQPAIGLFLLVFLLVIALRVVGIRVFAAADTGGFPVDAIKYRFVVALLFILLFEIGLIVTMIVLLVGPAFLLGVASGAGGGGDRGVGLLLLLVYLIVLGIFVVLPVLLYFARQEMVLGQKNPIEAVVSSWRTVKANFAAVFVLLALVFVLNLVVGIGLGAALGSVMIGPLITTTAQRIIAVFGIAISTRAYLQTQ